MEASGYYGITHLLVADTGHKLKIAELEKALVAPTDSGVVELDKICEKFNSTSDYSLTNLVCLVWNKAFFEALKEQGNG